MAGRGRTEGDAAAMWWESSESVQDLKVYMGMCGGRVREVNSSGRWKALVRQNTLRRKGVASGLEPEPEVGGVEVIGR